MTKVIFDKPTANIIFNGDSLKGFPPSSGTRQGGPLSPFLFNRVLDVLARAPRWGEKKAIQIRKGELKLALFAGDMISYRENPKDFTKNPLEYTS